jgi:hypothetical protein
MCALSDGRPAAVIDIEKDGKLAGQVTVRLQCEGFGAAAFIAAGQAEKDGEKLAPGRMTSQVDTGTNLAMGLEGVISLLARIIKVCDAIAEVRICCKGRDSSLIILQVHPYAKMAWSILTPVYQVSIFLIYVYFNSNELRVRS